MRKIGFWIEIPGGSYFNREGIIKILTNTLINKVAEDKIYMICTSDCVEPIKASIREFGKDTKDFVFVKSRRNTFLGKIFSKIDSRVTKIIKIISKHLNYYSSTGILRGPLNSFKKTGGFGYFVMFLINTFLFFLRKFLLALLSFLEKRSQKNWKKALVKKTNNLNLDWVIVPNPAWTGWHGVNASISCLFWDVFSLDDPSWTSISGSGDQIKFALENSHQLLSTSIHTKNNLRKLSPIHAEKVQVFTPPTTVGERISDEQALESCTQLLLRLFRQTRNSYLAGLELDQIPYILCATHFRKNKNLFNLIDAHELLIRKYRVNLKLVLTAPPYTELVKYISHKGLNFDVLFLSDVSETELESLFKFCQIVAVPSTFEGGLPYNNLALALKYGKSVVVSQMPTIVQAHNFNSLAPYSFYPTDIEGIAHRILACFSDPEAASSALKQFLDANTVTHDWAAYYKTVTSWPSRQS